MIYRSVLIFFLVCTAGMFVFQSYFFSRRQQEVFSLSREQIIGQQQVAEVLRNEQERLKADLQSLRAALEAQQKLIADVRKEGAATKNSLKEVKAGLEIKTDIQTQALKNENREWQKEYVATLLKIEQRSEFLAQELELLPDQIKGEVFGDISREINSIKAAIDKINMKLSTAAPSAEPFKPLPRFDPDWKK